jgi:capsular exopolysaccharide synthesis family protein
MNSSNIISDSRIVSDREKIDIKRVINRYLKRWHLFVAGVIICFGLAYAYLKTATPKYAITSTLLIRDEEQGYNFTKNALYSEMENYSTTTKVENEIEVLKSNRLMQKVLSELSLQVTYHQQTGPFRKDELYSKDLPIQVLISEFDSSYFNEEYEPLLLQLEDKTGFNIGKNADSTSYFRFGEEILLPFATISIIKNPSYKSDIEGLAEPEPIEISFNNISSMAEGYLESMKVELVNEKSSAVSIQLVESNVQKGKDIVNKLINLYNEEAIEDNNRAALNTIDFIDERLKYLTSELSDVERSVERYKDVHDITDVDSEAQLYLQSSTDYRRQLSELEIQIAVVESMQNYLNDETDRFHNIPSSLNVDNPTFTTLVNRYNEMQLERERMLQNYLPNNPLVQNLNAQLDNLRSDILQSLKNIKSSLEIARTNLQSSSSQIRSRVQRVPRIERELLEISRQQGIKQEHYLYLLKKREEAAIMLSAATVSNARIVDPATASVYPVEPNSKLILFASILLGLGIPLAFIEVSQLLNDKIYFREDIERHTKVPILGEIARYGSGKKVLISERERSPIAEQFRLLRSNLQFASNGSSTKFIAVTSTMSGEGKTFVGLNLGRSLSMFGKRVIVVEFDLRKPTITQKLGLHHSKGVSDYLSDHSLHINQVITKIGNSGNFFVITAGSTLDNPTELMHSDRIKDMLEELGKHFDHVIMDTSPVGLVADAFSLSPYANFVLYVVRQSYTLKSQMDYINDIAHSKKFNQSMIVFNGVRVKFGGQYVYGQGYN